MLAVVQSQQQSSIALFGLIEQINDHTPLDANRRIPLEPPDVGDPKSFAIRGLTAEILRHSTIMAKFVVEFSHSLCPAFKLEYGY